jgi:hypothetical protein
MYLQLPHGPATINGVIAAKGMKDRQQEFGRRSNKALIVLIDSDNTAN